MNLTIRGIKVNFESFFTKNDIYVQFCNLRQALAQGNVIRGPDMPTMTAEVPR